MKKLESFFGILFLLLPVGEANFVRFLDDHLQRLINHNPGGRYTPLITAFTALLTSLKDAINQRNLNQAQQESKTVSVDKILTNFKAMISRSYVDITDRWEEGSETFEAFFPRGLDEFTSVNKGTFPTLINLWISTCGLYREELPENYVTPYVDLLAAWDTKRTAQLGLIGNTDGDRLVVADLRRQVAIQLTKHVLTIALDNIGKPETVSVYFDQSIIRPAVKTNGTAPEPEVFSDAVAPASSAVIMHGGFDGNTLFHIVNTGSVPLKFYTANMPDDPVPGTALVLEPGEEEDILAADLGAASNLFLMAHNDHAITAGSYEVMIPDEMI